MGLVASSDGSSTVARSLYFDTQIRDALLVKTVKIPIIMPNVGSNKTTPKNVTNHTKMASMLSKSLNFQALIINCCPKMIFFNVLINADMMTALKHAIGM